MITQTKLSSKEISKEAINETAKALLSRSNSCYVQLNPFHIAALNGLGLTRSAQDLYILLHAIAPWGNFYCWNASVNEKVLQQCIARTRLGNRGGISLRTLQRAKKELREAGIVSFSRGKRGILPGFKLLKRLNENCDSDADIALITLGGIIEEQLDLFAYHIETERQAEDARKRQNRRDKTPKPLQQSSSGEGKERKYINTINKKKAHTQKNDVGVFEKGSGSTIQKPGLIQPPVKRVFTRKFISIDPQVEKALAEIGVAKEKVNRNFLRVLTENSVSKVLDAIAYTKFMMGRSTIMNPIGYVINAIKQGFTYAAPPPGAGESSEDSNQRNLLPQQKQWVDVAFLKGVCKATTLSKGQLMALVIGPGFAESWLPLEEAIERFPIHGEEKSLIGGSQRRSNNHQFS